MSKYLNALQMTSELITDIAKFFHCMYSDVKMEVEHDIGIVLSVTLPTHCLYGFCSTDFDIFCNNHELSGLIFFSPSGKDEVLFTMQPKYNCSVVYNTVKDDYQRALKCECG